MKKFLTILVIALSIFSLVTVKVNAKVVIDNYSTGNDESLHLMRDDTEINCSAIFDGDAAALINEILDMIRIIAPILMIILTAVDFASAVIQQDNDALKKATDKVTKRAIAVGLLFFVPTIVKTVFNLPGVQNALVGDSNDPLCGIIGQQ